MFTIIGGDQKEYGPVTVEQLRRWMAEHRVIGDTLAKRVGTEEWLPLRSFPEFGEAGLAGGATDAPPVAAATTPPEPIVFTGDWAEYFKIWIVNILLTIVTFGIYAAWAKVRKRRYFCANTRVFGHTFEYLADPVRILYGNLIVGGLFLLLTFSKAVSPILYLGIAVLFALAVPWFVVRALTFNARNTAWRGLRFNFTGTYGESAKIFLLLPILVPFTLGLIYPLIAFYRKRFVVNRTAYGTTAFSFSGKTDDFYRIYGVAALFFLPLIAGYFLVIAGAVASLARGGAGRMAAPGFATAAIFLVGIPLAIAGAFYLRARVFNYVWNHTTLAGNRFAAAMRARDLAGIQIVNTLVTLVTAGLLHPWAAVRMAKFQVESLVVHPAGNIDAFVASAQPPVGAVGDAASDFFDFDLGFGL